MSLTVDKRTGIGIVAAVFMMILSLMACALLLVRRVIPTDTASIWLWISYGFATLMGGRIAAKGQGRQLCALIPAIFMYVVIWLLALGCKGGLNFSAHGIGITICVTIGAVIAFISSGRNRKTRSPHSKRHSRARITRR